MLPSPAVRNGAGRDMIFHFAPSHSQVLSLKTYSSPMDVGVGKFNAIRSPL
jgi:hypothetical protein